MTGRILIIDSVATNRIMLKVKLLAAQYDVTAVSNQMQALAIMRHDKPDLLIVDLADRSEDRHAFCAQLRDDPKTSDIAIVGSGVAPSEAARLAALDVGAKEILHAPIEEALLLARVRNLLRLKNVHTEIFVRDSTGRALGFEQNRTDFEPPAQVHLHTADPRNMPHHVAALSKHFGTGATVVPLNQFGPLDQSRPTPDLCVIDTSQMDDPSACLFRVSADLRSRLATRLAPQLVIVAPGQKGIATTALDLGADDVVMADATDAEIVIRCDRLLTQKRKMDHLHSSVKDGLRAAVIDPLTSLYNRRYTDAYLADMSEKARQNGQDFAIMMIDIDHFKTINDTYGHAIGDAILKGLAERLRKNLRGIDMIARVGGEEFLVALPQSSRDMAELAADRVRKAVNTAPFDVRQDAAPIKVTVSIGVAVGDAVTIGDLSPDSICHMADTALYAAKSAGRDQVSFAASAA